MSRIGLVLRVSLLSVVVIFFLRLILRHNLKGKHFYKPSGKACKHGQPKIRGVITYLVAGNWKGTIDRLYNHLLHSLPYLEANLINETCYPLIIFHMGNDSPTGLNSEQQMNLDSRVSSPVLFIDISAYFRPPKWVENDMLSGKLNVNDLCSCGELRFGLDYCVMNRFFITTMFDVPIFDNYDYWFRFDADSYLIRKFPSDPFQVAFDSGADFVHIGVPNFVDMDFAPCLVGLDQAVESFLEAVGVDVAPSIKNSTMHVVGERWQGQFMLGKLKTFLERTNKIGYQSFTRWLDLGHPKGRGIFVHRWADQNMIPIVFAMNPSWKHIALDWQSSISHNPESNDPVGLLAHINTFTRLPPRNTAFLDKMIKSPISLMKGSQVSGSASCELVHPNNGTVCRFKNLCTWRNPLKSGFFIFNKDPHALSALPDGFEINSVRSTFRVITETEWYQWISIVPKKTVVWNRCCVHHVTHHVYDDGMPLSWLGMYAHYGLDFDRENAHFKLDPARRANVFLFDSDSLNQTSVPSMINDLFSGSIFTATDVDAGNSFLCFEDVVTGSPKRQLSYGMGNMFGDDARRLAKMLTRPYNLPVLKEPKLCKPNITLMNRIGSRTILNEKPLSEYLQSRHDVLARVVHLQELNWASQMKIGRSTDIFIYIHGAAMVNALFLKPGSVMLTLYQFCQRFRWDMLNRLLATSHNLHYYGLSVTSNNTRFHHEILESHGDCLLVQNFTHQEKEKVKSNVNYFTKPIQCSQTYWLNQDSVIDIVRFGSTLDRIIYDFCLRKYSHEEPTPDPKFHQGLSHKGLFLVGCYKTYYNTPIYPNPNPKDSCAVV